MDDNKWLNHKSDIISKNLINVFVQFETIFCLSHVTFLNYFSVKINAFNAEIMALPKRKKNKNYTSKELRTIEYTYNGAICALKYTQKLTRQDIELPPYNSFEQYPNMPIIIDRIDSFIHSANNLKAIGLLFGETAYIKSLDRMKREIIKSYRKLQDIYVFHI